jgi:glycosyltransferase involved in cell wall biosynthesis
VTAPLVSVIIPYYNHGRHLHQTVHAALRAYSGPLDIIIVNDGSAEAKAEIFLQNACDISPAVRVIAQANGGLSAARNTGIAQARGAFVQLLDSDDLLTPGKIDLQVRQFQMQPRFDISVTNYILCDEEGTLFTRDGDPISRFDFTLSDFLFKWERGFSIPIHCGLFRRAVFDPIQFETNVIGKEDWIFWCRQAHANRVFGYLPVYGAIYRQHSQSMSKSFKAMGDSWLVAAETVDRFTGGSVPGFLDASRAWYDSFYKPQIEKQIREGGVSSAPAAATTAGAKVVTNAGELSWIEEAAARRIAPSLSPVVSVIVPVFNHFAYLPKCLASLVDQVAGEGVEIILADDCSSDPRVRPLLEAFAQKVPGVRTIFNARNVGIAENQNTAVAQARGKFVAFVDCDDNLEPGAIKAAMQAAGEADYVFTDRTDIDETGKRLRVARYGGYDWISPSADVRADLLDGMVASHLKIIRRQLYLDVGGSDPMFGGIQDWELALKIAARNARFAHVPQALYNHRIHQGSVTQSQAVRQFWLSNVARRRFSREALGRHLGDEAAIARGRSACAALVRGEGAAKEIRVMHALERPENLAQLKQAWREGEVCIYAPKANSLVQEMNLVREFNSYFDAVLAPDEGSACFFLGYMWDHRALTFVAEAGAHRFAAGLPRGLAD